MVIGGIVAGVFSATEGSAIAVVYSLILGICYRNITWKSFWNIVVESAKMSGMVVFLIGVSNILGWVMAFLQIPRRFPRCCWASPITPSSSCSS